MSRTTYKELQARYIAGDPLSSQEASCLLQWLHDSPGERHQMLTDDAIDSQLHCLARLNDDESTDKFVQETIQRAASSQRSEDLRVVTRTQKRKRRRSFQVFSIPVGLCTAALVLLGVAIAWYATTNRGQDDFGFAKITNERDLSWKLIDDKKRRLSVSSGYGEVHFDNGTIAHLSAPAVIELRTPQRLFVKTGVVKMDVPPAAVGFTVETPIARIGDSGTEFEVDVGDAGQTETRVRSGTVTFSADATSLAQRRPIKLTAEGLNRVSAEESTLTKEVRSIVTRATGSQGQFFGTIHADGNAVEFSNRRDFDGFQDRLNSALQKNPSQFRDHWNAIAQTSNDGADTAKEGDSGGGLRQGSPGNRAQEMLIDQLRSMQQLQPENTQMQELLEGMKRQVEEGQNN